MKNIFQIGLLILLPFFASAQAVTIEPTLSGFVGNDVEIIGKATSSTPLKLFSNGYYNFLRFYTAGGQEQGQIIAESGIIGLNGLGKTTLNVNSSPRLTVNSDGNVGIGNNYNGDFYKLSVKSNTSSIASFLNEDPSGMINLNYNDKHFLQVSSTAAIYYGNVDIDFQASNAINFETGLTSRLFVGGNFGNVGVGTKTPTAKLEVNGYTKLGSDAPAIKILKINSTTASTQGGSKNEFLPFSTSRVISVNILVEYASENFVHNQYTRISGLEFDWTLAKNTPFSDFINVTNIPGNSTQILSKPMKIIITYEE
jgi:hypothetical protein